MLQTFSPEGDALVWAGWANEQEERLGRQTQKKSCSFSTNNLGYNHQQHGFHYCNQWIIASATLAFIPMIEREMSVFINTDMFYSLSMAIEDGNNKRVYRSF